jgi:hypothetical protein
MFIKKSTFASLKEKLHKKDTEWQQMYGEHVTSPYTFHALSTEKDGRIWLNPRHQDYMDGYWLKKEDLVEWIHDEFNSSIFKSKEHKREIYFLESLPHGMSIRWAYDNFTGLSAKYFDADSMYGYRSDGFVASKINRNSKKKTLDDILSFVKHNYKQEIGYIYKDNHGCVQDPISEKRMEKLNSEAWGILRCASLFGLGYYGASNTPCNKENFAWVREILFYEALFERYVEEEILTEMDVELYFTNSVLRKK